MIHAGVPLSMVWGWTMVMLQLHGFYCISNWKASGQKFWPNFVLLMGYNHYIYAYIYIYIYSHLGVDRT